MEEAVFACIQRAKGAGITDHEAAAELNVHVRSITPRRRRLVQKGRVRDSGLVRLGPFDKMNITWITGSQEWTPGSSNSKCARPTSKEMLAAVAEIEQGPTSPTVRKVCEWLTYLADQQK